MRLNESEIRKLNESLKSIEDGMDMLKRKRDNIYKKLGRELEANNKLPSAIVQEDGEYKVVGLYYKVHKIKEDGSLSKATKYIEVED